MTDEAQRLDMMMEIERLNALKIQEEIELRRHLQNKQGASMKTQDWKKHVMQITAKQSVSTIKMEYSMRNGKWRMYSVTINIYVSANS
ncbi:unnamed protein product [Adineta steineri]|uniref:Uncharacterized protein n=1 Tax=Adineta steineri TaxID=433720 RepID=A0A820C0J6_9BILA|nr:unnamed protein product [Adineta steineri]